MARTATYGGESRTTIILPLVADAESQRARILNHLRTVGPLTTTEARTRLDIMHPAAHVQELRERGHNIITHRKTVNTGKGRHRVAEYVLLAGGEHG